MSSTIPTSSLGRALGTYGYIITFGLGLIGHSCSLLTFSQRQLRSTSTTLLFLSVTISDLLYLFISLYHFLLINLGVPQLSPYYIPLCRFRTFIFNFTQTTSVWLLICITFDRLIRARLPHRSRQWCTQKNAIIALCIIITSSVAFNSHVLLSSFTVAFPTTRVICGPMRLNATEYTTFYYFIWPPLQISINILIPALLMIIGLFIIYKKVRNAAVVRQNHQLQNQMLLLTLSKIILFLACTSPYGIYRMNTLNSLDTIIVAQYQLFFTITTVLTILLNANFSMTFYVHCLTSTLFRKAFYQAIKNCVRRRQNVVRPTGNISILAQ